MSEAVRGGRVSVNGVDMYYEVHGAGDPLVLLHGALSGIGTSFGVLLPALARRRRVIAVELQGHGRTPDTDRPLDAEAMACDVAGLLREVVGGPADVLGYSMGGSVAMERAAAEPGLVRSLVLVSVGFSPEGLYPEVLGGIGEMAAEDMAGSPFYEEYMRTAPDPQGWAGLFAKVQAMDADIRTWSPEELRAIAAPVLLAVGDSDIVRPEHAAQLFRFFGGGVPGDLTGLPAARLAVLPGTTHITAVHRDDLLVPMVEEFLTDTAAKAGPAPEAG